MGASTESGRSYTSYSNSRSPSPEEYAEMLRSVSEQKTKENKRDRIIVAVGIIAGMIVSQLAKYIFKSGVGRS